MTTERTKLAADTSAVLSEAAGTLRKIAAQNVDLAREVEALRLEKRAMQIAMRMTDRGIEPATSFAEKVALLCEQDETKLAGIESALAMQLEFSIGKVAEAEGGQVVEVDSLNDFILSGQALT
jgi:hypothetical protein